MRQYRYLAAGAAIAATISGVAGSTSQELCAGSSQNIGGNYYCKAVKAITYKGVGYTGSYNQVTLMDAANGQCNSAPHSFSGQLAPLCDEIAMHIRGPVHLNQFAVYYQNKAPTKKREPIRKRHGHQHLHKHRAAEEKREMITATIDGKVVSWANDYNGAGSPAATPPPNTPPQANTQSPGDSTGDWLRAGYYNAQSQTLANLTFLNNMGGQGSGVFDTSFGNSLAYASSHCNSGSSSPQILADAVVPSNTEYSIWSGTPCNGNDCGYSRPGTVPFHGFNGGSKVFLLEFSMPSDSGAGGANGDMPAIWFLNAQIGRTLQYGKPECSCWTTGCGEFDVFEVLDSGNFRCKSTIHVQQSHSGGDSNYFTRPTGGPIKVAILFDGPTNSLSIQTLDSSTAIPGSLTQAQVTAMWNQFAPDSPDVSVFQMP
ncbi:MAG: target of Sbf [Geoglossum simile]|nr:MAG: target of Sbf [Geoglossum simile]